MNLQSYLDEHGVNYRASRHTSAYTAQELAAAEHFSGKRVIKPVIIRADGQFMMCALPACYRVDINELKQQLLASDVKIADEQTVRRLFADCEPGAEPPIGRIYGMTTLMDESLSNGSHVLFQAGTHQDAVEMTMADYRRIAQPEVAHFGRRIET